jgi:soluble lytic murein transglycosylase-like protein
VNSVFQRGFVLFVILAPVCAQAADLAVLRNGNSIRHEHRQVVGQITRLYLSDAASGYIEIPTDQILRFEHDTAPAPVLSKPQSPVPQNAPSQLAVASPKTPMLPQILDRAGLDQMINGAGDRHQIDPDFINSVIRAESGFKPRAVSKKGAQGLMQLMPQTASQLGVANPFDPNANVEGGTKYLRELLEKYNFDVVKALAAYNAGPKRVDRYRGVPPYYETQAYIARIIKDFNRQKLAQNPALAKKKAGTSSHSTRATGATKSTSDKRKSVAVNSASEGPPTASR